MEAISLGSDESGPHEAFSVRRLELPEHDGRMMEADGTPPGSWRGRKARYGSG